MFGTVRLSLFLELFDFFLCHFLHVAISVYDLVILVSGVIVGYCALKPLVVEAFPDDGSSWVYHGRL